MNQFALVALPVPMRQTFSYRLKAEHSHAQIGARVKVPFGPKTLIGFIWGFSDDCQFDPNKIKDIISLIDDKSILNENIVKLARWGARYYIAPLGMMLNQTIPVKLRKGEDAELGYHQYWKLSPQGNATSNTDLGNAKKQIELIEFLRQGKQTPDAIVRHGISKALITTVANKGLIEKVQEPISYDESWRNSFEQTEQSLTLNSEQAIAVARLNQHDGFQCCLLEGITGSGKTEVYLSLMASVLEQGKQVLVLVPEIGLTPQTIARFSKRFKTPIVVLHSGLNDTERCQAWLKARAGAAGIIIGTRSALFTPMKYPGLIILDEEHDASFKQNDGIRYHARDLAVMRGQIDNIPVLLGSATPSLESLNNALSGKYLHLYLNQRAGEATPPRAGMIDIRQLHLQAGISQPLFDEMGKHLQAGNQVMLFLNRRGFAPALLCHECGHLHECKRCDAYYTLHRSSNSIVCHHCGDQDYIPRQCPNCSSTLLMPQGVGTEQLQELLEQQFPDYPVVRIDRDTIRNKGELEQRLDGILKNEFKILIGTQMLAKGHHFPDVTLVGMLEVDGALFSSDFRASEKVAQLISQVSGRAGRASKPGTVVLQSHQTEHPVLQQILFQGYQTLSRNLLLERQQAQLPPAQFMAIFKAEAFNINDANHFLAQIRDILTQYQLELIGPMPAPMERRAGKFRQTLIIQCNQRKHLHLSLESSIVQIEQLPSSRKCRWHLDIDPIDLS
ncbi:primosomal protein N' [Paraferrimonas sp. SM1919]|uniref:primosomal protein N' n=1 Tax=Paraferrimonas sp. SM1919 TaxID=2662263 RepID=UPI0013D26BF3|nr:primosomal protein N' [Paraferrimonas sp. SM1919]